MMNPLTNVKNIQKLNQRELELGVIGKKSWHDEYKDSAWVFIGGLPYDLTEGDIVCVFSQYGEIVNINLVRDKSTGKSKGFAFLCYEDQRSTVLAVDNLNSIKVLGRIIRVDHVSDYKKPKEKGDEDEVTLQLRAEGCAPKAPQTQTQLLSLEEPPTIRPPPNTVKAKKVKKEKKKKKKKKKKMKVTVKVERRSDSDSSSSSESSEEDERQHQKWKRKSSVHEHTSEKIKHEKQDSGYERAVFGHRKSGQSEREGEYEGDSDRKPAYRESEHRDRGSDRYQERAHDQRHREERAEVSRGNERDRRQGEERRERERDERSDHRRGNRDRSERRDKDSYHHRDTGREDRQDKSRYRDDDDKRRR